MHLLWICLKLTAEIDGRYVIALSRKTVLHD